MTAQRQIAAEIYDSIIARENANLGERAIAIEIIAAVIERRINREVERRRMRTSKQCTRGITYRADDRAGKVERGRR